jgi:ribosomal-protein-alanine N-acetyltransferase
MKAIIKPINISFRKLLLDDVETIVDIEKENTEHPWSSPHFSSSIVDKNTLSTGLVVEQKLIGYVLALVVPESADLLNIGIHPNYKRQGYGEALLTNLLVQLKESAVNTLILEVRVENHIAINFYQKQGFEGIGTREKYYSNREDAKIMKLHIPY